MATNNKATTSVAQAAYEAASAADFVQWLDTTPATDKDGAVKTTKQGEPERRVASVSANYTGDAESEFWAILHHPLVAERGRYDDGTLSYITRYGMALVQAEASGELKVPAGVRDSIKTALDAQIEAQRKAQAERMSGMGAAAAVELKAAKAKAEQFDKVLAMLTDEQRAALGLS
jgi:hypothetical protein